MSDQYITITKVKTPWYAFSFLLKRGFRKAVPEYEAIEGLVFKYFSSTQINGVSYFGGIYLWETRSAASKQFSTDWFARVKQLYKDDGRVEYYKLIEMRSRESFDFKRTNGHCVALFFRGLTTEQAEGFAETDSAILRVYLVEDGERVGLILLFTDFSSSERVQKKLRASAFELFHVPVFAVKKAA